MVTHAMDERAIQPFFILGAPKCGSTSLHDYVEQHPDVFFAFPKEPIFFELEYERGLGYYREHYFSSWNGEQAVGDARAHHLGLPFVPERIAESYPRAKLVAVLRDPVMRAHSHWWHRFSRGLEALPFPLALRANLERLQSGERFEGAAGERAWRQGILLNHWNHATKHRMYLDLGYYAEQLERYRQRFPPDRIHVLFFDDLTRDPAAATREVWRFLGIDANRSPRETSTRNPASTLQRSRLAARVRRWPRPAGLQRLIPAAAQEPLRRWMQGRPARKPEPEPDAIEWLREHFAPHEEALEALLERPLPWRSRLDANQHRDDPVLPPN